MKAVTGGMLMPPNVPTMPVWVIPAATYPARNPASSIWNVMPRRFCQPLGERSLPSASVHGGNGPGDWSMIAKS